MHNLFFPSSPSKDTEWQRLPINVFVFVPWLNSTFPPYSSSLMTLWSIFPPLTRVEERLLSEKSHRMRLSRIHFTLSAGLTRRLTYLQSIPSSRCAALLRRKARMGHARRLVVNHDMCKGSLPCGCTAQVCCWKHNKHRNYDVEKTFHAAKITSLCSHRFYGWLTRICFIIADWLLMYLSLHDCSTFNWAKTCNSKTFLFT